MLRRAGTDKTDEEMIHEELSDKIIRAAMDVPLSCRAESRHL